MDFRVDSGGIKGKGSFLSDHSWTFFSYQQNIFFIEKTDYHGEQFEIFFLFCFEKYWDFSSFHCLLYFFPLETK